MIEVLSLPPALEPSYLSSYVGLLAGFLGVSVAVYLQMVAGSRCPPQYVAAFFLLGSGLILANFAALRFPVGLVSEWLPVVGNAVILLMELWGFRHVLQKIEIHDPSLNPLVGEERT